MIVASKTQADKRDDGRKKGEEELELYQPDDVLWEEEEGALALAEEELDCLFREDEDEETWL